MKIRNMFGERLDVDIKGRGYPILFVHGYGTDKDEGFASFLDASKYFSKRFTCIRFDQAGYGKSEGKDYEFDIVKSAGDYAIMFKFILMKYGKPPIVWAHSLGGAVSSLFPLPAKLWIWTSPIPPDNVAEWLKNRIISKGGRVDENGITVYPRSSGKIQLIGGYFWRTMENLDMVSNLEALSILTKIEIFMPTDDELFKDFDFSAYERFSIHRLPGDHNFRKKEQRLALFRAVESVIDESLDQAKDL